MLLLCWTASSAGWTLLLIEWEALCVSCALLFVVCGLLLAVASLRVGWIADWWSDPILRVSEEPCRPLKTLVDRDLQAEERGKRKKSEKYFVLFQSWIQG